jgi:hypothetical protein
MPSDAATMSSAHGGTVERIVSRSFLAVTSARELIRIPSGSRIVVEEEHDQAAFVRIRWSERSVQVFGFDLEHNSEVVDRAYPS